MQENNILDEETREVQAATGNLYTLFDIGLATFIGSPLAGAYMIASNSSVLFGRKQSNFAIWTLGIVLYLLPFLSFGYLGDLMLPSFFIIPVLAAFAMFSFAKNTLEENMQIFWNNGGGVHTKLRVLGVSFAFLLLAMLLLVCFLCVVVSSDEYGRI